ncbi:TonB family protein [Desulfovibrio aminophilus]|nr:TonB family protein [Desulfovibrio aminophilus]
MRQKTSLFFSIILHLSMVCMALFWQNFGGVKIDMEVPAYTVDLVNIAPGPPPGPVAPGPAIPAQAPNAAPPTMNPESQAQPEQAAAVPEPPKPQPKPEPAKPEPVKPEPVKAPEPPKPQPKPEPVKTPEPPKPAKPEPKPEAKPISETKAETKKPEPRKAEPAKPEPSNKDILASALQDVKKEAAKDAGKSSGQPSVSPQQQAKNDVQSELAALRKSVGGSIYSTGGGGGGGGGGSGSSGLLQVYASIVEQAIKKNWRYPVFGNDSNLVAVVEVRIDAKGQIADVRVLTPSARSDFDDSAVKAVRETKELPAPPSEAVGTLRINFNLQELNR